MHTPVTMPRPTATKDKLQVTVDFNVDPQLYAALQKFLATDREMSAPGVMRNALRAFLASKDLYAAGDTHIADEQGNVTRIKK